MLSTSCKNLLSSLCFEKLCPLLLKMICYLGFYLSGSTFKFPKLDLFLSMNFVPEVLLVFGVKVLLLTISKGKGIS